MPTSLSEFNCNFDNRQCRVQWRTGSQPGATWSWLAEQGSTPSRGTGPAVDKTTGTAQGTYMFFEASYPRRQGDRGELMSPMLPAVTNGCRLRFSYHMYGSGMGSLRVLAVHTPGQRPRPQVFSVSGNRGNRWHTATVNLPASEGDFFIIFQAIRGTRFSSDIAIDDVEFVGCTGLPSTSATTAPPGTSSRVRLVGGANAMSGRVEVYHLGEWGTVCDDQWEIRDANVVCRSLGYGLAESAQCCASAGRGSGRIWMDELRCNGQESSLTDCIFNAWGAHDCGHGEDAAVVCSGALPTRPTVDPTAPQADLVFNDAEMLSSMNLYIEQLTAEQVICSAEENCLSVTRADILQASAGGRLSSRHLLRFTTSAWNRGSADFTPPPAEPQWHACHRHYHSFDDYATYDLVDSAGVKRGFGHKASFCLTDSACDPGVQPKYECGLNNQGISINCSDAYGANLDCQWVDMTGLSPGVYWLTVHINPARIAPEERYDNNDATVMFNYTGTTITGKRLVSGPPQGNSNTQGSATPTTQPQPITTQAPSGPDVRLVSRDNNTLSGRVEVRINGVWGTVCDDRWDFNEGNVVCRQLGLGYATDVSCCGQEGNGAGQIWLDELQCAGNEQSLTGCRHSGLGIHNCLHSEDAGVTCSGSGTTPQSTTSRRVRLVGGPNQLSGRVEVFAQNQWGTVCDDHWTLTEAAVVCKQLGLGNPLAAHCCSNHGQGTGSIWLDDVRCTGTEQSLLQCSHPGLGQHNCAHSEDASVACAPASSGSSGSVGQAPLPASTTSESTFTTTTSQSTTGAAAATTTATTDTAVSSSASSVDDVSTESNHVTAPASGCFAPGIPQNGGRTSNPGEVYQVNDTVTYNCESGYSLIGDITRSCQPSGQWTGTLPTCQAS
eukprot:scpid28565/ scgid28669/ Lysyl oxidase homolog 2A; Lysyl oxidase-like protein 2A